jgi:hypothetical protein
VPPVVPLAVPRVLKPRDRRNFASRFPNAGFRRPRGHVNRFLEGSPEARVGDGRGVDAIEPQKAHQAAHARP